MRCWSRVEGKGPWITSEVRDGGAFDQSNRTFCKVNSLYLPATLNHKPIFSVTKSCFMDMYIIASRLQGIEQGCFDPITPCIAVLRIPKP